MLKKLYVILAFITLLFNSALHAYDLKNNRDTLISILQKKDQLDRHKRLIKFIKIVIETTPADQLLIAKRNISQLSEKYNLAYREAFLNFMESLYLNRLHNLRGAKVKMERSIQLVAQKGDSYLLYMFTSHLAFIETDIGNFTGAVYNYRTARKEALKLKDNFMEALLDINISDLYYKANFYTQSINYLNQAQELLRAESESLRLRLSIIIYYNKAENYFRMRNYDSLKFYHQKLNDPRSKSYKIYTYRFRTAYYMSLVKHNYPVAIKQINMLKKNPKYVLSEIDNQNLADAYFMIGKLDSAKILVNEQLAITIDENHPEIKYHLYELLAQVAEKEGDVKAASTNYMLALKQSLQNNARISQMGNISSQMKIDETENTYNQRTNDFKRQRLWLIFTVIIAALIIVAIALIYRNVKQKRHYERLLYVAKKEELAFINSHEVRKHLTNILGIIDILQHSENKLQDYKQAEPYLLKSAAKLDEAIKSISEKLNEY
jgi:hypothetical protein